MNAETHSDLEQLVHWIESGDVGAVQHLLRTQPSLISSRGTFGDMPLHHACWQKKPAIVKLLVNNGADVNAHGDLGRTPLHYAAYEGDETSLEIAEALIASGAD